MHGREGRQIGSVLLVLRDDRHLLHVEEKLIDGVNLQVRQHVVLFRLVKDFLHHFARLVEDGDVVAVQVSVREEDRQFVHRMQEFDHLIKHFHVVRLAWTLRWQRVAMR